MLRIAVAPCSPFSVTTELMKESAALARRLGLRLHTHIAEALDEDDFCLEKFGVRPIQLLDDLEFLGPDVWLAHGVHLSDSDISRLGDSGTGIAHCPSSNLRLASGIARIRDLVDAGGPVGLGVDGSASNDSNDLLAEVRQAMFSARAGRDPTAMSARDALRLATRGGAACLGRSEEIGSLEPGKRADVALFDVTGLAFAGAQDMVAALAFCSPQRVRDLFVEGRPVVAAGRLTGVDEERLAADGHRVARRIAEGATACGHGRRERRSPPGSATAWGCRPLAWTGCRRSRGSSRSQATCGPRTCCGATRSDRRSRTPGCCRSMRPRPSGRRASRPS
jgi:cytosine/adenosine deaminase-related metal-dependent hydrolase